MIVNDLSAFGILAIVTCSALSAARGGYTPLNIVMNSSDAIVAARIAGGQVLGSDYSLTLSIDRTYKGPSGLSSIQVKGRVPPMVHAEGPVRNTDRGLWFLRRLSETVWEPVELQSNAFIRGNYYRLSPSDSPGQELHKSSTLTAQIVEEVAAAIASNPESDEDVRRMSASLKGQMTVEIRGIFERLLSSASARARLLSACVLIQGRSAAGEMLEAERVLEGTVAGYDRAALIDALYSFRGSEPQSVTSVGRLATAHRDAEVRRAATYSLSRIHTPAAVPYLVSLLDSGEQFIRAEAVSGLSLFVAAAPIVESDHDINAQIAEYRREGTDVRNKRSVFDTSETRRHFHRGNFADTQVESDLVRFWKDWYTVNRHMIK